MPNPYQGDMNMKFVKSGIDRWNSGPYTISKYDDGYYAYRYFRYALGGQRDAKRLHPEDKPLKSYREAISLCAETSKQSIPNGIKLIDAPFMAVG
jgi:hypothetical protein